MSASNTPTGKKAGTVNAKDAEFMFRVVQNMEDRPVVNWEKVAAALNYKNATVASTRFNQIKKKMESSLDGPASTGSGTEANTPTKGPKPKANKVTKAPAKTRTPRKEVAQPVKKGAKGAKSAVVVTKEDDSGLDEEIVDEENEAGPAQKLEFNHEEIYHEMDEADYEQ